MPDERTYGDEEVAEIFKAAAESRGPGSTAPAPAQGFTLAELQAIGSEVGLAPERVAEAAAAVDLRRGTLRRSDLGMPVSVGRAVELPRAPTDREWAIMVADLQETFQARGRTSSRGEVHEWHNGNLHVRVEPTATGYRLRLGTTNGQAVQLNRMGPAGLLLALVFALMTLPLHGTTPDKFVAALVFAALCCAALAWNALRLPAWAQEREAQMEGFAARAQALLGTAPPPRQPVGGDDPLVSAG